jgi:hypothetical protein
MLPGRRRSANSMLSRDLDDGGSGIHDQAMHRRELTPAVRAETKEEDAYADDITLRHLGYPR